MSCEAVIEARNLSIGYRRNGRTVKCVHKDLSFSLYSGQLTCLLGPNGAGKSTLLRTLSASQKALAGEWRLNGKPANRYSERELSRWIGLVLTDRTFAGGLRVSELVSLGRYPHTGFLGRLSVQDKEQVQRAMEQVGIADKAHSYVAQLSDGERQKVMIAKALAQECPVVLLDEPTAFLDVVSRIEMMNLLHDLAVKQQKTILLSTHDLEQALSVADEVVVFYAGETIEKAKAEDFGDAANLRHPYTRALWYAMPEHGFRASEGTQPYAGNVRKGCPYTGQCPVCREECRKKDQIPLMKYRDGEVRCLYPDEIKKSGAEL